MCSSDGSNQLFHLMCWYKSVNVHSTYYTTTVHYCECILVSAYSSVVNVYSIHYIYRCTQCTVIRCNVSVLTLYDMYQSIRYPIQSTEM